MKRQCKIYCSILWGLFYTAHKHILSKSIYLKFHIATLRFLYAFGLIKNVNFMHFHFAIYVYRCHSYIVYIKAHDAFMYMRRAVHCCGAWQTPTLMCHLNGPKLLLNKILCAVAAYSRRLMCVLVQRRCT